MKMKYIFILLKFYILVLFLLSPSTLIAYDEHASEEVISAGAKTYYRFCSICHGKEAKGDGPFSENIKVSPPDLTVLSANNGGIFPWLSLYEIIDGQNVSTAHGTKEMPIWGEMFDLNQWSSSNIENASTIVHGRIFELMMYLKSIQAEEQ